jgi:phosphoglucosamine mutase
MVSSPIKPAGGIAADSAESLNTPSDLCWGALNLPKSPLFGTDGIRGKAGDLLTAPLAMQIGYWAGQVLRSHHAQSAPVILGQDSRNSGDMLASALAAGLTSAGLEVWNLGLCPTATVAYLTEVCGAVGGVMISASHNPPEDNGIKFFGPEGTKLSSSLQAQIEQALRFGMSVPAAAMTWGQCYQRPELVDRYISFLHKPLQPGPSLQGMKIVLDMAWGSATRLALPVFEATGAEVLGIHGLPDGDRINVNCGSTHLEPLKAAVKLHGADVGFAFDGDADRVIAVDAQGRVVDGDYILYFWGKRLSEARNLPDNTIISTVMANLGFERAWQGLGGQLVRTQVGDQYVHAEMVKRGAKLGGEQSGHILCHHYSMTGDGILTALHLASLVRDLGGSLAALVDQSFETYPQRLQNVRVEDRERRRHWQNCDPVVNVITEAEQAMGEQGRVLVRPSGTEPVIRVMVEAVNRELVDLWTDRISAAVTRYLAV